MAKKALINKANAKTPKYKVRAYTRCQQVRSARVPCSASSVSAVMCFREIWPMPASCRASTKASW